MKRLIPLLFLLAGCGASAPVRPTPVGAAPAAVDAQVPEAPDVVAHVGTYKAKLGERLSVPLVHADAEISPTGEPSNALGLLVSDLLLAQLRARPETTVDCFVTNDGGLRAPLYAGQVELRHVYEVMPFDNELVILEVDGATVQRIADRIAAKGGEPVAGLRMVIAPQPGRATAVEVAGRPLDPAATYRLGTTDYLSESGWMSELVKGRTPIRTGVLMRDAIAEALKAEGAAGRRLAPKVDDRIRVEGAK